MSGTNNGGAGTYSDRDGRKYIVQSGLIGVIPFFVTQDVSFTNRLSTGGFFPLKFSVGADPGRGQVQAHSYRQQRDRHLSNIHGNSSRQPRRMGSLLQDARPDVETYRAVRCARPHGNLQNRWVGIQGKSRAFFTNALM
jgi:hypothetical protein